MSSDDYQALEEEIDSALEGKARGAQGLRRFCRAALVAGGLAALALVGLSAADAPEGVPPHEERIAYLREHLQPSKQYDLEYEPPTFFNKGAMALSPSGALQSAALMLQRYYTIVVGMIDTTPGDKDTSIDSAYLLLASSSGYSLCTLPDERLGPLEATFDRHYELSTDAWYRSLTEGNTSIEGAISEGEYNSMMELCRGRWESQNDIP